MFAPFGTHVLDRDGNGVGTVSRLVLHPDTQQVVALVIHQGVLNRRDRRATQQGRQLP
jgi:sporulation protein YlmC with PRC-barrel domain